MNERSLSQFSRSQSWFSYKCKNDEVYVWRWLLKLSQLPPRSVCFYLIIILIQFDVKLHMTAAAILHSAEPPER